MTSTLVLLMALAAGTDEETYTCRDAAGDVVLQNEPCEWTAKRQKKPVASPAAAAPPPPAPAAKKTKVAKPANAVPAPAPAPASPAKALWVSPLVAKPIKPIIDRGLFTADPRWGSPERTLHTFIDAMKAGDRKLARSCLTSNALAMLGTRIDEGPPESLRATVASYTGFVVEGEVGPFWSIRALRANERPKWIFFERFDDGTWKIAAI